MKLQQEANRKILELADKAQTEAIRSSFAYAILSMSCTWMKFIKDLHYTTVLRM